MIGCWFLWMSISCSRLLFHAVQGPGHLVSCGHLLSCRCFVFLRSNLVVVFYFLRSFLRFLRSFAVVFDFLRSWGSCSHRVLAVVGFLRSWGSCIFPLASAIADFSLASLGHWLLSQHGWLLVLCLLSRLRSWLPCLSLLRSLVCRCWLLVTAYFLFRCFCRRRSCFCHGR